jgi:hypothetical protein
MKFELEKLTFMLVTGPFTPPTVTVGNVVKDGCKFISSNVNCQIRGGKKKLKLTDTMKMKLLTNFALASD